MWMSAFSGRMTPTRRLHVKTLNSFLVLCDTMIPNKAYSLGISGACTCPSLSSSSTRSVAANEVAGPRAGFSGVKWTKRYFSFSCNSVQHASKKESLDSNQRASPPSKLRLPLISSDPEVVTSKSTKFNTDEWKTIYRFNHIKVAGIIQRFKIYQTGFTCCLALPGSVGLYLTGSVPFEEITLTLGTSALASVMLYIIGTFCSRLIGIMYVSKTDPTLVRVAHLNFWGRREDNVYKKTDFIPFSELNDDLSDVYVEIKFYSELDAKLYLCLRYGNIFDIGQMEEIFGELAGATTESKRPAKEAK